MRIAILLAFGLLTEANAEPFDFYIKFLSCKILIGYIALSDESLKVIKGETSIMGCKRDSNIVKCSFEFDDGGKSIKGAHTETYQVVMDVPPHLHFRTESGSEYIAIDTSQHAAADINRLVDQRLLGRKCARVFS